MVNSLYKYYVRGVKMYKKLENWLINFWKKKHISQDIRSFDLLSEIDNSLTFEENKEIIIDKLKERNYINNLDLMDKEEIKECEDEYLRENQKSNINLFSLFDKPKIIGLISDVNEGKSNMLYWIIEELKKTKRFNLYGYGLRKDVKKLVKIYSIEELEKIKNSLIIIDEVMTLFDLDNRMIKRQIESTLRLIHHNNNILILSAVPENIKKFISSKLNVIIYKRVTFEDFINGSSVKRTILNYKGNERGYKVLNLDINEAIIYDKEHYTKINIPYLKRFDTKLENVSIFVNKNVNQNARKKNV